MIFNLTLGVMTDRQHQVEDVLAHRHAMNATPAGDQNIRP
jgi:hypothetical protein